MHRPKLNAFRRNIKGLSDEARKHREIQRRVKRRHSSDLPPDDLPDHLLAVRRTGERMKIIRINRLVLAASLFLALDAPAQAQDVKEYNLGVDSFRAKNYESARQHWTMAIAADNSNAYNSLGFLLFNGLGGKAEPERAVALWRDAATLGNAESQWHLAYAYEAGKGTLPNDLESYAWYRCAENSYQLTAAAGGKQSESGQDASQSAKRVFTGMPESQRKMADELAKIYIALYSRAEKDD